MTDTEKTRNIFLQKIMEQYDIDFRNTGIEHTFAVVHFSTLLAAPEAAQSCLHCSVPAFPPLPQSSQSFRQSETADDCQTDSAVSSEGEAA